MRIKNIIKGFTLIELLVVITIIGILATGAVSVYTSQIQKSRDSVRLTDIKAIQWGIEQFYQDIWEYPTAAWTNAFSWVLAYVPKMPQDPKSAQWRVWAAFDYLYNVSQDINTIPNQEYEVSTTFEQDGNMKKAKNTSDWWDDDNRLEFWINVSDIQGEQSTKVTGSILDTVARFKCVVPLWTVTTTCDGTNPMLIRKN